MATPSFQFFGKTLMSTGFLSFSHILHQTYHHSYLPLKYIQNPDTFFHGLNPYHLSPGVFF
jgi:hypothetical protein